MKRDWMPGVLFVVVVVGALLTVGCDKMPSPTSPTTSSAPLGSPPPSGAVISGSVTTGAASHSSSSPAAGVKVTVAGTSLAASADGTGRFTLNGVQAGNVTLQVTGPGINATVNLGAVADRERVEVEIHVNGNAAALDDEERVEPDEAAEVEGAISSIDASAKTLVVGAASVQVTADTTIRADGKALQFSDLTVGERVEVKGAMQGSMVSAQEIDVKDAGENPQPQPGDDNEAEVNGTVDSLVAGTSCAAQNLAFLLKDSTRVNTSASPRFDDGSCTGVAPGATVEVKGPRSAGAIAATRVKFDSE